LFDRHEDRRIRLLQAPVLTQRLAGLTTLVALEITRYLIDFAKFGREASDHMWSPKLWDVALFVGSFALLVCGADGLAVSRAIYMGIWCDLEGLAISFLLREWRADVLSLAQAWRIRRPASPT